MRTAEKVATAIVAVMVFGFAFTTTQVVVARAFGPSIEPVRYTWQVKKAHKQVRKCEVWYPDNRKVDCSKFEQSALNEFPLVWADPHRNGI